MGPARHEQVAEPNLMNAYARGRSDSLGDPSLCAELKAVCSSSEEHITSTGNRFFQTVCPAQVAEREETALEWATS